MLDIARIALGCVDLNLMDSQINHLSYDNIGNESENSGPMMELINLT